MSKRTWRLFGLTFVLLLLVSCESISYYSQATRGQLSLLMNRQDIDNLLQQSNLPDATRAKLQLTLQAREFAQHALSLPVGNSYRSFVALEQSFVVWNVFAAPELAVEPRTWCYPIAGCVSYRGYFSETSAQRYASRLSAQGLDVFVGGVDAYSTLGWFDDPLTSPVLRRSDSRLVGLIFHELAHQVVYVPDDTVFNESFASFVEREGLRRWVLNEGDEASYQQYLREAALQEEFIALVLEYRKRLNDLYLSDLKESDKLLSKQTIVDELRATYEQRRDVWDYRGYDNWFAGELNNAQLSTVASYNHLVPAFASLLAEQQGDLAAFYARVQEIAQWPATQREQLWRSLAVADQRASLASVAVTRSL